MSLLNQYAAAHEQAVIVDRSSRGRIEMSGGDRRSFLHALLTNDIAQLAAGHGIYAAYLTPQGRMISDLHIFEIDDRTLLGVEGTVAAALAARFDKLIFSEDVQVADVSSQLGEIGVHGPSAAALVERVTGLRAAELVHDYDNLRSPAVVAARNDELGVPGVTLFMPAEERPRFWSQLLDAGAVEANDELSETLRLEAGRPRFGVDMDTDTIPMEAGIEGRAISWTKGCYVGQEVVIRVMHRGHGRVAKRLVRLVLSPRARVSAGDRIVAGDKDVGHVTSVSESPAHGSPIAFGYVQRDHVAAGTELSVLGLPARVDKALD